MLRWREKDVERMVSDWRSSHFSSCSCAASSPLPSLVLFALFECLLLHALVPALESNLSPAVRNVYTNIELPATLALARYELAGLRTSLTLIKYSVLGKSTSRSNTTLLVLI